MKISGIRDRQKRATHLSRLLKQTKRLVAAPATSTPVFVFGSQRSGTTMLMNAFELHPDTEVHDEASDSSAFFDFRVRSLDVVKAHVDRSKAPTICFKTICDSHIATDFAARFPHARHIWIYRDYRDVANSVLRKFDHATHAVQKVCRGQTGGGWFQEGCSEETTRVLQSVYSPQLTGFEFGCLEWWARNRCYFEQGLHSMDNVLLLRYEDLVTAPENTFRRVLDFTGLPYCEKTHRLVHASSIRKHDYPELTPKVAELCDDLAAKLEATALGSEAAGGYRRAAEG